MAEKETVNEPKDVVEPTPEELKKLEKEEGKSVENIVAEGEKEGIKKEIKISYEERKAALEKQEKSEKLAAWVPKTKIGKDVKSGKEKDVDNILEKGKKILEPEIIDSLLNLESELISIGQAKGKFGGGKRRVWRQTQKKTKEGNILTFSAMAIVGDKKGHIGIGYGKAKETLPARKKAIRIAKLNLIKIKMGCGNFDCLCNEEHSVPFVVEGKCGSVRIKLIPAPQGTGLVVGDECKKILRLVGIKDVYGASKGHIRTTFNLAKACIDALSKTTKMKI
ncbi:MAG: 30S ribosomal protein S5 [Nanoarchaeota archaeon]|nr:30S ribosomal protein S5 [Nanoarchaeota archaeon]